MQPFACKLKAENKSRSDDPLARMILVLGSLSFHVNGPVIAEIIQNEVTLRTHHLLNEIGNTN